MSIGEEKKAFEQQKKLQEAQNLQRQAENLKKIAEAKAITLLNETELELKIAEQAVDEKLFRISNPNKIYSRDLAEDQLQKPYDEKLNDTTYIATLNNVADFPRSGKTNKQYSIEKIFNRTDKNSDGELYLWYPHVFEKNSENKFGDSSIVHVSQLGELEKYGAYHFQVQYFPQFRQSLVNVANHAVKDLTEELSLKKFQESGEELLNTFKSRFAGLGTAGENIVSQFTRSFQTYKISKNYGVLIRDMLGVLAKSINDLVDITPQSVFTGQSGLTANIYLPFNKLDIRRESGVTSKSNVITNIGTSMLKGAMEYIIPKSDTPKGIMEGLRKSYNDAQGRMLSEFKAPRLKNPELDIREFQWELIPRTSEEHRHIMYILSFFASLSVPTFERNDMLFYMPPMLTMRVLSSKIKNNYDFETYVLVPSKQYFLIEYSSNFNYNEDSVMLDENGMPVGVTLNIRLIKNELVTGRELFQSPLI